MLGALALIPGAGSVASVAVAAAGFLLRCTACLIALAILAAAVTGDIHGHRKANAKWTAKWQAAELQAEVDRKARDVAAKARMEADANGRIEGISTRADELETKVRKYEADETMRRATGNLSATDVCITDSSDDQWLLDLQRRKAQPKARGGLAGRLRARLGGSSDPRQPKP